MDAVEKETSIAIVGKNLEITYREHSRCFAVTNPGCSGHDKIWKEIYRARGGKIYLWKKIGADYTPEIITRTPEKIEWGGKMP